jgi:hypothetical protein
MVMIREAASTSETSVNLYQTTRRNNPEDSHLQKVKFSLLLRDTLYDISGSEYKAPIVLKFGTRGWFVVNILPRPLIPWGTKTMVSIGQEACLPKSQYGRDSEGKDSCQCHDGDQTPVFQPVANHFID